MMWTLLICAIDPTLFFPPPCVVSNTSAIESAIPQRRAIIQSGETMLRRRLARRSYGVSCSAW
jgi:hypothetical protein